MAIKLKLIETSPAPVLIPVRGGRKSNKELGRDRKFLTPEEVERLKKVVKQNRNESGIGYSFIWPRDMDFVPRNWSDLSVRQSTWIRDGCRSLDSRMAFRLNQPLDAQTMRALRKLYRDVGDHEYVFISERRGPMAREAFQRIVERAGKLRGLALRFHPIFLDILAVIDSRMKARMLLQFKDGSVIKV